MLNRMKQSLYDAIISEVKERTLEDPAYLVKTTIDKWFDENVLEFGVTHTISARFYKNQGTQYNSVKRNQATTLQSHLAESLVSKGFVEITEGEKDNPHGIMTSFRMWAFKVPK